MVVDVAAFVGGYPYRHLPWSDPEGLLAAMDRVGIERAWVGHLPSFLYRDPRPGNAELARLLAGRGDRLLPVPTIHPALPRWEDDLAAAGTAGAPAVRVYPGHQGVPADGAAMRALCIATAAATMPVILTVRFEDVRQRHPLEGAGDFPAAAVRTLARVDAGVRLLVTHADRAFIEEVHFGLTPDEAARVLWDVSGVWGPPEDHLARLVETVGMARLTLGTGMPLRIPEAAFTKLDLLDLDRASRAGITAGNLERWRHSG